jgi:sugar phosphate isomerase/epimerase
MNTVELMDLYWTTAGVVPGVGDEISRHDFRDRVEAAARAGFKGIGIWHTDLEHTLQHRTLQEMRAILDDNDMKYIELEFLTDWFVDGSRKSNSDRLKKRLLEASQALHAKHIKIGDFQNTACPMPRIIEAFSSHCEEAQEYDATIGFEFMASSMIDNLDDALTLVETAAARNGGLILDIVHVATLDISYEAISKIPKQYVINVELNDGALPGSPRPDPPNTRRFCGEGEFDIKGFVRCVQRLGYTGPWAVEVFSEELAGRPLDDVTTRAFATTMAQFDE